MSANIYWWHHRLLRRALTRPVWWWHKHRPWPIRQRIFGLPPWEVATEVPTRLVTMSNVASLADAAWMARSFLAFLDRPPTDRLALTLYLDSDDPAAAAQAGKRWQNLFPGSVVRGTRETVASIADEVPEMAEFGRVSASGRKLAVLLDAQLRGDVLFADSDVLMFREAPELAAAIRDRGPVLYNQEVLENHVVEPLVTAHAQRLGWPKPAGSFNSGLLYLPQDSISPARVRELLVPGEYDPKTWIVEQTIVALLLPDAQRLPRARYVVSQAGQFYGEPDEDYDRLVVRHYISTVRHQMYARGMPLLWRRWRKKSV